jgi:hypothetical protein
MYLTRCAIFKPYYCPFRTRACKELDKLCDQIIEHVLIKASFNFRSFGLLNYYYACFGSYGWTVIMFYKPIRLFRFPCVWTNISHDNETLNIYVVLCKLNQLIHLFRFSCDSVDEQIFFSLLTCMRRHIYLYIYIY